MQHLSDIPNILPIRDIVAGKDNQGKARAGLVVEFFEAENHLTLFPKLSKYQVKLLIYQTLETLSAAHSRGVIHRDITPFNVLMNGNLNQAKVIDWGLADYYRPGKTLGTSIATLYYKSPEMLLEYRHYDYSHDVWATGCLLAEMVFLKDLMFHAKYVEFTKDQDTPEGRIQHKFDIHKQQLIAIAKIQGTHGLKQLADKLKGKVDLGQMDGIEDYEKVPLSELVK